MAKRQQHSLTYQLDMLQDTPEYRQAIEDWILDLKERRQIVTQRRLNLHLKILSGLTPQEAVAELEYAISKGWDAPWPQPSHRELMSGEVQAGVVVGGAFIPKF